MPKQSADAAVARDAGLVSRSLVQLGGDESTDAGNGVLVDLVRAVEPFGRHSRAPFHTP